MTLCLNILTFYSCHLMLYSIKQELIICGENILNTKTLKLKIYIFFKLNKGIVNIYVFVCKYDVLQCFPALMKLKKNLKISLSLTVWNAFFLFYNNHFMGTGSCNCSNVTGDGGNEGTLPTLLKQIPGETLVWLFE